MKTHFLKNRHDRRREKRYTSGYSQPNTSNNSMKTHLLKHRHDRGREKRYIVVTRSLIHITIQWKLTHYSTDMIGGEKRDTRGGYSQPNTSNNSMKTHQLKHRHDTRREKRYMVVTHSLIHLNIQWKLTS